jgi:hypothetical protein
MLLERSKQGLAGPDIADNGNTRRLPEIPVTIKTFAARGGSLPRNDYQLASIPNTIHNLQIRRQQRDNCY